jgi:hypothetical protein
MLCVENRRLAGIAPKSNVSISRVTGGLDAYELFVDSARTLTVLPARTVFAACRTVRQGAVWLPGFESFPVVDT